MDAGTSDSQIYVEFMVAGTSSMDRIGCESMEVYENVNGWWDEIESLDEFDSGMVKGMPESILIRFILMAKSVDITRLS